MVQKAKNKIRNISIVAGFLLVLGAPQAHAASTLYVDPAGTDSNNNCTQINLPCKTIGHAMADAVSGDTIQISAGTFNENLSLTTDKTLTFIGAADPTDRRGVHKTTITSSQGKEVVKVDSYSTWSFKNLVIQGGDLQPGKEIRVVRNSGRLTFDNCLVTGGNLLTKGGAGILNGGILSILSSKISGNSTNYDGGGIYNTPTGEITLKNSTVSNNKAAGNGAGIFNDNGKAIKIINSTISSNQATSSGSFGGGIHSTIGARVWIYNGSIVNNSSGQPGGGLNNDGTSFFHLFNTIVAKNSPDNCNDYVESGSYNLEDSTTSFCFKPNNGNQRGTDPKIGDLSDNGGPTPTHALPATSPAIDKGDPQGCKGENQQLLDTDQRDKPRPIGTACDIGAYERGVCGDGFKEPDEECDGGADCDASCKTVAASLPLPPPPPEMNPPATGTPTAEDTPSSAAKGGCALQTGVGSASNFGLTLMMLSTMAAFAVPRFVKKDH